MKSTMLCLLILALLFVFCGCAPAAPETTPTEAAVQTTLPSAEPTAEATTEPTTIPTETEPPAPVYHSGLQADGTFTEGTLFLGDSQTYMLLNQKLIPDGLIGSARYAARCGSQVTAYFDDSVRLSESNPQSCALSPEFDGMTFREAAMELGENATAIYLMWGTNFTPDATAETYIEILDDLLEICPNATIHLQTIPYGRSGVVACYKVNDRIRGAFDHYQQIGEPRVYLVDTFNGIGKHVLGDGVHLTPLGLDCWYQTLLDHAQQYSLPA